MIIFTKLYIFFYTIVTHNGIDDVNVHNNLGHKDHIYRAFHAYGCTS